MNILDKILDARDKRYKLRKTYSDKGNPSLSLSLNIPGYPKSDKCINTLFNIILKDLIIYLQANRISLDVKNAVRKTDEAGDFFIAAILNTNYKIIEIKTLCESFESNFYIRRIIDIDITDKDFNNISSKKLKKCYICKNSPAVQCMKENKHTKTELRNYLLKKTDYYLNKLKKDNIKNKLFKFALKAALYETSLSPKPGLVDRFDSGIHKDMDFFSYINSTAAISVYFKELIKAGYSFKKNLKYSLPAIRNIGLKMEEDMFTETGDVNTQKGIIFLFGITLFSIAYILKKENIFNLESYIKTVKSIAFNLSDNELTQNNNRDSHGEICFLKYGLNIAGGIRSEVENGLPTVIKYGLPALKSNFNTQIFTEKNLQKPLTNALVSIMAHNNDTNILFRGGVEKLETVKKMSSEFLNSDSKDKKKAHYDSLIKYCNKERISPGGSSDLLALSILLFFVENEFNIKNNLFTGVKRCQ